MKRDCRIEMDTSVYRVQHTIVDRICAHFASMTSVSVAIDWSIESIGCKVMADSHENGAELLIVGVRGFALEN